MQEWSPQNGHPDQRYGHFTYAHCGEDIMVINLFEQVGIKKPSYMDVGAHHPYNISNTALMYQRGCRGVNIEANPKLMEAFKRYRPEDINVNVGISLAKGKHEFYMWDDRSGRNTFNPEWRKNLEKYSGSVELDCITLNEAVDQYCNGKFPDFLSIDIEGLDYPVLASANFYGSSPKIICAECHVDNSAEFAEMLGHKGYRFYSRHALDVIYVRNDIFGVGFFK